MSLRVRRKRAAVEDLYKSCKAGGDCIPDVKNKVEGDTWADRLLKWFGSFIYLGNLGIGTGRGSGGTLGYRPIETGAGGRTPAVPVRPTVPTDIVPEAIPGLILPEGPSVVPLTDLVVDTGVIIDTVGADLPTDVNILFENTNPTFDITSVTGHPTVISSADDTAAVIDVGLSNTQTTRISLNTSLDAVDATSIHEVYNIFVDPQSTGSSIGGFEEIELEPLHRESFEIQEARTSTPQSLLNRALTNVRRFYGRSVQQVPVRNPAFLYQPSSLVQFEYENPAFTPDDLTLRFQQDVADIAAAPDSAFSDVRILHRQELSETPRGTVRASRLGTRGYMRTRANTLLGQNVHYYYDISSIEPAESTELATIVDLSGNQAIPAEQETSFVYSDNDLLDDLVESFNDSHLVLQTEDDGEPVTVPMFATGSVKVFITDINTDFYRPYTKYIVNINNIIPRTVDLGTINAFASTYDLHPSYLRKRKRKRRYSLLS